MYKQKPIYPDSKVGNYLLAFGAVALIFLFFFAWFLLNASEKEKNLSIILSATWVVGVPVYFFIEHVFIFRNYGDASQFEQFKRLQDQAAKIWVAAVLVLGACYAQVFPGQH